ncbi:hypothetical protein BJP34_33035 [Moorena producens PAL-8-15-08-1]|uniref:Bacterial CdiA-CT RNAse A domain-containing protein n=1 Tax=Moorena producens PAL-8-15-08-1 TaxID=1458985 RepID=A0A1D8U1E3_9CYAN|nr:RNase A-like domain-containing protein [Moorena producens]AOX03614.1 hypothetical protein BJP34_33035 [Moorena producens PAL-8-15-08-1]
MIKMLTDWKQSIVKGAGVLAVLTLVQSFCVSQSASAQCVPSNFPSNWLRQQEDLGGKTINRHVGKTDQQLVNKLINNPKIAAASTYPDLRTAANHIKDALRANRSSFNNWVLGAAVGEKRAVKYRATTVVGRVASSPPSLSNIDNTRRLRVVMIKTAQGDCLLNTSYPVR